jgi:hypothetical protein
LAIRVGHIHHRVLQITLGLELKSVPIHHFVDLSVSGEVVHQFGPDLIQGLGGLDGWGKKGLRGADALILRTHHRKGHGALDPGDPVPTHINEGFVGGCFVEHPSILMGQVGEEIFRYA